MKNYKFIILNLEVKGGTDNPSNLITLCEKHHKQLHEGKIKLDIKKHKELKTATIMNVIRKRLLEYFPEAIETFGYKTKVKIRELGLIIIISVKSKY